LKTSWKQQWCLLVITGLTRMARASSDGSRSLLLLPCGRRKRIIVCSPKCKQLRSSRTRRLLRASHASCCLRQTALSAVYNRELLRSISFLNKTKAAKRRRSYHIDVPTAPLHRRKSASPALLKDVFADHPSLRANQTKPSLRPWLSRILV
jgi:hypothetical protein